MGEHGQGGPAVPGVPAPDLVLIESDQAFGGLEGFLDAPALTGDGDQGAQRDRAWGCSSAGRRARRWRRCGGSANDGPGVGVVFGQQPKPRPGVQAWAVGPAPAECFCQACGGISAGSASTRIGPAGWARAGWPRSPAHSPGGDRGRGAQPRVGAIDFVAGHPAAGTLRPRRGRSARRPAAGLVAKPRLSAGIPASAQRSGSSVQDWAGTGRGRSARAHAARRRSDTPPLASSRCGPRCRCTGAAPRPCGALLHVAGLVDHQDRAWVTEGVDDVVTQIITDRLGVPSRPRQQMLQPIGSRCTAVLGDRPAILAIQTRDHPGHQLASMAQAARNGQNAARSDRSPPRTQPAIGQGLRYEPRRPRQIQMCSQTPNNAAVTALTSADTPAQPPDLRLQY